MSDPVDIVTVINKTQGREFSLWDSVSLRSEFLTPCDSFHLEAGSDVTAVEIARALPQGSFIEIQVNGRPQLTGYVDKVKLGRARSGGTKVTFDGRDMLGPVVRGNVDPRMKVAKETTLADLADLVIVKQYGIPFTFFENNEKKDLSVGKASASKRVYSAKHKRKDPLKDAQPKENEGAFSYLARIFTHAGYWLWATPDGSGVVIGGPDYDQTPSYELVRRADPAGYATGANNILAGWLELDETDVPSDVFCRGVDGGRGTKQSCLGTAHTDATSRFVPVFLASKEAKDKAQAERIARTFLARQMKKYFVYDVTVQGFTDRTTGNTYAVDTVANVRDEECGISDQLWIESRSFEQSRGSGSTTKLRLIPRNTLVLDWSPEEAIPVAQGLDAFVAAARNVGAVAPAVTGQFEFQNVGFFQPNT